MVDRSSRQSLWGFDFIPMKNNEVVHGNESKNALGMLIQQNSLGDVFAQMMSHNREEEKRGTDAGNGIHDERNPIQPVVPPKIVIGDRETSLNSEGSRRDSEKQMEKKKEDGGVGTLSASSSSKNMNKIGNRGHNSDESSESETAVHEYSGSEISSGKVAKKSGDVSSDDSENSDSDDSSNDSDSSDTTGSSGEEEPLDQEVGEEEEEEEDEDEGEESSDGDDDDDDDTDDGNLYREKTAALEMQKRLAERDGTEGVVEESEGEEESEDEANGIQTSPTKGIEEEEDDEGKEEEIEDDEEEDEDDDDEEEEVEPSTEVNLKHKTTENRGVAQSLLNESVQEATDEDSEDERVNVGQRSGTANKNHPRFSLRDIISENSLKSLKASTSLTIAENGEAEAEGRVINSSSSREVSSEGSGHLTKEMKLRGSLYRSLPKTTIHLG